MAAIKGHIPIENEAAYYRARNAKIIANAQKTWRLKTPDHEIIENFLWNYFNEENKHGDGSFYGKLAESLFTQYGKLSEKQCDAVRKTIAIKAERRAAYLQAVEDQKARSEHLGVSSERIEVTVTVDKIVEVEVQKFNWFDSGIMLIYLLRDQNGNRIVYKTKSSLFYNNEPIEEKTTITIKATVKMHSEYKGEKQTIVQRAKVVSVTEANKE